MGALGAGAAAGVAPDGVKEVRASKLCVATGFIPGGGLFRVVLVVPVVDCGSGGLGARPAPPGGGGKLMRMHCLLPMQTWGG